MTKKYGAREVHDEERRDTRADVYSLGCVFLEICTVLAGLNLDDLEESLCGNSEGGNSWWEEGVYAFNVRAIEAQLDRIERTGIVGEPVDWCRSMLKDDSQQRPRIQALRDEAYDLLREEDRHGLYFCSNCITKQELEQEKKQGWMTVHCVDKSSALPKQTNDSHLVCHDYGTPPMSPFNIRFPSNRLFLFTDISRAPRLPSPSPISPLALPSTSHDTQKPDAEAFDLPPSQEPLHEMFFTWYMFERLVDVYCQKTSTFLQLPRNSLLNLNTSEHMNRIYKMQARALCLAAALGDSDLVQRLLRAGVKPNFSDFISPSQQGNPSSSDIIRLYPPLIMAALETHDDVLKQLIDRGVLSNEADLATGATALHYAAAKGSITTVELLLDAGFDQDCRDHRSATPLIYAVRGISAIPGASHHKSYTVDNRDIVEYLLCHNKNANAQDRQRTVNGVDSTTGANALHYAAAEGSISIMEALLDAGCSKDHRDHKGAAPLFYAVRGASAILDPSTPDGCRYQRDTAIDFVRCLLHRNVNVHAQDITGIAVLHIAAYACNQLITKVLIDAGAQSTIQDDMGRNALHWASYAASIEIEPRQQARLAVITRLLEHGADIHSVTKDKFTALSIATITGQESIARFLSDHGALQNIGRTDELTFLDFGMPGISWGLDMSWSVGGDRSSA